MARQDLLSEFNRFPDEDLVKLITIGDSILSPMSTELTSADFSSMVNMVFKDNGLADTHFPEWGDRTKSDFGRLLVELFALFSDKDFFYINHFSREGFLKVAEQYRSIFHKALHQGFNPPSNTASMGNVELIFSAGVEETAPRGAVVLGMDSIPDLVYTSEPFVIPESEIDQNITVVFRHGKLRREQIFFDGFSLVIDTPNVVANSIKLKVDGVEWLETDNLILNAGKKFMAFYDENGRAELYFRSPEDATFSNLGTIPAEGGLCDVEFLVGGGYIGDIGSDTLNRINSSQTNRNLNSFTQFEMTGGNSQLGKELLRETVIGKARHQNRIVTPEDAEYFCKELEFVQQVSALSFNNYLYLYVLPTSGGDIDASQKLAVENKVTPQLLLGYRKAVSSAIFVPITMKIDVYLLPNTVRAGALAVTEQTIDEYLDPLKKGKFGQGVKRSILGSNILRRVGGIQNVTFPVLFRGIYIISGDAPMDLDFLPQELIDLDGSDITINLIGGI